MPPMFTVSEDPEKMQPLPECHANNRRVIVLQRIVAYTLVKCRKACTSRTLRLDISGCANSVLFRALPLYGAATGGRCSILAHISLEPMLAFPHHCADRSHEFRLNSRTINDFFTTSENKVDAADLDLMMAGVWMKRGITRYTVRNAEAHPDAFHPDAEFQMVVRGVEMFDLLNAARSAFAQL